MGNRLFGLEAELAVSATRDGRALPTGAVVGALAQVAQRTLAYLPGGGSRMFLASGGLFYVDCGNHPEVATPECTTPSEAVCHLRAGERMVARLAGLARDELKADAVLVCRSNVDYSGATWGCHESILGNLPITAYKSCMIPHLVSRIVYTGSGGLDPLSPGIRLSISPRVAYIDQVVSAESTSSRGIFHTRDESLCKGYSRIHVLAGCNACSQRATWLKIGTTALVVALAESDASNGHWIKLADPVGAMKGFARDLRYRTQVQLKRGSKVLMTALDIQRHLLSRIEARASSDRFPDWAPAVCTVWKQALDLIETPAIQESHAFDWPLKLGLFRREIARRGFTEPMISAWSDALERLSRPVPPECETALHMDQATINDLCGKGVLSSADVDEAGRMLAAQGLSWQGLDKFNALRRQLCAIDMRFGELGAGIFESLDRQGVIPDHRVVTEAQISAAAAEPPERTRAHLRGQWVKRLSSDRERYRCSWEGIRGATTFLDLGNPFATEADWQTHIDHHAVRQTAFECYRDGKYPDAEALLVLLLEHGFEPADINCHLARICLITDRVDAAREHAAQAWAARETASPYVVARTLWTRLAVAFLDSANVPAPDVGVTADVPLLLGQLKTVLQAGDAVLQWTMEPVINHFASRLTDDQIALLAALVAATSDGELGALEALEPWRTQEPVPVANL